MFALWELLRTEDLLKLVQHYQIRLSTLKATSEGRPHLRETFEEIDRLIREKKAVESL